MEIEYTERGKQRGDEEMNQFIGWLHRHAVTFIRSDNIEKTRII